MERLKQNMNRTADNDYLYAIADHTNHLIKLGYARDPQKRCAQLQTGNPNVLSVVWSVAISKSRARLVEQKIHQEYNHKRVRREWFKMSAVEAEQVLNHAVIRWQDDINI
jgi:predicted GIY-YIG superfamily endonuclease